MGLSSSKSETKSNQSATTTPTTPAYAMPAVQGYYGQVGNLGQQIGANPSLFTTPANDTQNAAFTGAQNLGGWQSGLDSSNNIAQNVGGTSLAPVTASTVDPSQIGNVTNASSASLLDGGLDRYLNPATDQLVNTTLADFDNNAGRQTAAFDAAGARAGAFGGSRFGIADAQLASDQGRDRASTEAGLRSSAFNAATGLAQSDAANRQQANLFNAGSANTAALNQAQLEQQASLFNAGAQNTANEFNSGLSQQDVQNQLAAAGLLSGNATAGGSLANQDVNTQLGAGNAQYAIDQANNLAPLTSLAAYQGLIDPALLQTLSGQKINTTGDSTTKTDNGLLGSLLGVAGQLGGAAILHSDRRVKRDIEQIGRLPDGLGVYRYNYLWDEPSADRRTGVMADEVAELRPWAVGPEIGGIRTVDYGRL